MKKWIVVGLSLAVAGTGSTVFAATPEPSAPNAPVATNVANLPPSVVDDIPIPYDVVMYAQLEYQGYAITHAYKGHYSGQPAYRLHITRDDTGSGYDGYQLWYDHSWKLIGQEKMTRPVIIKKEEPKPEPKQSEPTPSPTPPPSNPDNGGRGGGNGDEKPGNGNEGPTPPQQPTPPPPPQPVTFPFN